jgi:hypothetical protein
MQWSLQIRFEVGFELGCGESEAEWMTAVKTNVFRPTTAGVVNRYVMTQDHTCHGMSDHLEICLCFKERMPAPAGVFSCLRVFFDDVNAMTQKPAEIVNFLFEFVMAGIRVRT